jgi:hypothetical protein
MGIMVFNATLNNISVISWWSVLLVQETGVSSELMLYVLNLCESDVDARASVPMCSYTTE